MRCWWKNGVESGTNLLLKYSDGLECHVIALRRSKMY